MASVWLSMVLGAAVGLWAWIRRRYNPGRTRRRLLVPTALVERACLDALAELNADHDVFTSTFEPACAELSRINWADVAALGPEVATSHRVLVRVVEHWNAEAGGLRSGDEVASMLAVARRAAEGVMGSLPPTEVAATREVLDGQLLRSIVATPPEPGVMLH